MPRKTSRKKATRKVKLGKWARKGKKRVGGFILSFAAIAAAISAAIASAAPVVATAALGSATAYGVNKALTKIGGSRTPRIRILIKK